MRRRGFLGLAVVGLAGATASGRPEGVVPHEFVDAHGIPSAAGVDGISAERVLVSGEDGAAYRLSDVLRAMLQGPGRPAMQRQKK